MQRRLLLLAGVGAAVLLVAASATATTKVSGSANGSSLAAAPFAESWANVPRTPAARKAKTVLVFGAEQDITGFNTLNADESALWAQRRRDAGDLGPQGVLIGVQGVETGDVLLGAEDDDVLRLAGCGRPRHVRP